MTSYLRGFATAAKALSKKGPSWLRPDPLHRRDPRITKSEMDKYQYIFNDKQKYVHPKNRIKYWQIAPGDRVRVVGGTKKDLIGKEGTVLRLLKEHNTLQVEGINIKRAEVSEEMEDTLGVPPGVHEIPQPIEYKDVRLVGEIKDQDGKPINVIVENIKMGKIFAKGQKLFWKRYIPFTEIDRGDGVTEMQHLPWPSRSSLFNPNTKTELSPLDTPVEEVDRCTFQPSLVTSPLPIGLERQLILYYSRRNRTKRATEAYQVKAEEKAAKPKPPIYSPEVQALKEFNRQERLRKRKLKSNQVMSPEVINLLVSRMEKKKSFWLEKDVEASKLGKTFSYKSEERSNSSGRHLKSKVPR